MKTRKYTGLQVASANLAGPGLPLLKGKIIIIIIFIKIKDI